MKSSPGERIAVFLPTWVGDVVLATPTLRAIREHFSDSYVGFVLRPNVAGVLEGSAWADELFMRPAGKKKNSVGDFMALSNKIRDARFDTAVLLTNSFRSALLASLSKIRRRIGYSRDGRMLLLTDYLIPAKHKGKYLPVSMRDYYLAVAKYMGCEPCCTDLQLFATPSDEQALDTTLAELGVDPAGGLVTVCPGAAFGPAKCWFPERFAAVSDRLAADFGVQTIVSCGPREMEVGRQVQRHARGRVFLPSPDRLPLGALKALVRRSKLVITNDTGPRHFAIALQTPVVTVFGPTDPAWTETNCPRERRIQVAVDCGPCMKRHCPLDHRCMTGVGVHMVYEAAAELLTANLTEVQES